MVFTKKFAGNFIIQITGKFFSIFIGLITIGILTRYLGAYGFGEYTTAITFLQLFGVVVDLGLTLTLIVMISEPGADEKKIVSNIFTMRILTSALMFGICAILVWFFPWSPMVKWGVVVGSFAYTFMAGAAMLVGLFQKHQTVWRASLAEFLNRLVFLVGILVVAQFSFTVVTMIAVSLVANLAWLVLMVWFAKPYVQIRPAFDVDVWKGAMHRGWPIAISIFFNLLYMKGDTFLLSLMRSPEEVGIYGAAYRVIDMLTVIPAIFMGLLLPSLVADWKKKNREEFQHHLRRAFDVFMIMVIPIVAGVQALGVPLATLIAGKDFAASGFILQLLIWAVVAVFVGTLFGHAVVALEKQKGMIVGYAATAVVGIAGYLWAIPRFGMQGAAWMTIASESMIALLTFFVVWKPARALPSPRTTLKAIFSALLMYGVLRLLPELHVIPAILLGAVVYIVAMLTIGGVRKETILELMPESLSRHRPS